ncbi:MAG TPA: helix-turn-helix domain-containing protein [Prolixibacteraceae bacterium]|nr:helix-turn-helix domain-containing protein [Prolixibacteraceae bacterium]HPS13779.1 helix-turn-helix domain-containing protein [Prolixibacteraceae bacterium]
MEIQTNPQLKLASDFLQYTNENIFLTGKAGTGKTTFLHNLRNQSPKRMVVVAPTGVAAINAGGVTIHSFFQISFGPQIPYDPNKPRPLEISSDGMVAAGIKRFNKEKINIIRSLDLLVIDEISMVRADLLDAVDEVLRRFKNKNKPFGGVQLLMIGDLQQLAPVVKDDEWEILKNYYDTCFFFSSRALQQSTFTGIELKQIFRQSDQEFIDLLNAVRENRLDGKVLDKLNSRYVDGFNPPDGEGYITLTTHNFQSQQMNETKLGQLKNKPSVFTAVTEGDFPEYSYPTDFKLILKVGAQVMFVKNDPSPEKRFFNGKIGKITAIGSETVSVLCPGESEPIEVEPAEWQNYKYALNETTEEIEEIILGKFTQFPLKLAWAITIHKSQGLTFEKAVIDARLSFAHGQVYVALSRCRSLEGLVLRSPIVPDSVKNDQTVLRFTNRVEENQPGERELNHARRQFQLQLITDLFDFKPLFNQIQYLIRNLSDEAVHIQGNMESQLRGLLVPLQTEMITVADKFHQQVIQLFAQNENPEENPLLQERIKNGCLYFIDKLKVNVEDVLANSSFQTDNKAIRKTISENFDKVLNLLSVKKACLEGMKSGFSIKGYLDVRSKASIEKDETKKFRSNMTGLSGLNHPDFYKTIFAWRSAKADELDMEISRVIPQKTLLEIAQNLPSTATELKAVKGMGGKKMTQFGKEILKLIIAYRKEKGMDLPVEAEKELKKAGQDSRQQTFELYLSGMTVAEIARERGLAASTIESHLLFFVEKGLIDVEKLVDEETFHVISKVIEQNPEMTYSGLKAILGDDYSYAEIRFVATAIQQQE